MHQLALFLITLPGWLAAPVVLSGGIYGINKIFFNKCQSFPESPCPSELSVMLAFVGGLAMIGGLIATFIINHKREAQKKETFQEP